MSTFLDTWAKTTGEKVGRTAAWWTAFPLQLFVAGGLVVVLFSFWFPHVLSPLYRAACASIDEQLGAGLACQILDWLGVGKTGLSQGLQTILPEGGGGGFATIPEFDVVEYTFSAPTPVELLGSSANVYAQPNGALVGVWTQQDKGNILLTLSRTDINGVTWLRIPWTTGFGWVASTDVNQAALPSTEELQQKSLQSTAPWSTIPDYLLDSGPIVTTGTYAGWPALHAWSTLRGPLTETGYHLTISRAELPVLTALSELNDQWQMLSKIVATGIGAFEDEWWALRSGELDINSADSAVNSAIQEIKSANVDVQVVNVERPSLLDTGSHNVYVVGVMNVDGNEITLNIQNNDIYIWVLRTAGYNAEIKYGLILGGE